MSAVVLGVLVMLWAVVLVPMWLNRRDRSNELASADRFAGAMRVLSRRTGYRPRRTSTGRYVMMPPRPPAARAPQVSAPRPTREVRAAGASSRASRSGPGDTHLSPARETRRPETHRRETQRVLGRRRLVLLMAASLLITFGLAVLKGGLFIAVQAFSDVLILAGLAHIRGAVVAERAQRAARAAARRADADLDLEEPAAAPRAVFVPADQFVPPAPVAEQPVAAEAAEPAVAQPVVAEDAADLPLAVGDDAVRPLVKRTAPGVRPPARRRPANTVDLTQPGKWTQLHAPTVPAAVGSSSESQQASPLPASTAARPRLPQPEASLVDTVGFDDPITAALLEDQRAEAAALAAEDGDLLDRLLDRAVGE